MNLDNKGYFQIQNVQMNVNQAYNKNENINLLKITFNIK